MRGDFDEDEFDDEPEEPYDSVDCHLDDRGWCGKAGSEECDFECPYRDLMASLQARARIVMTPLRAAVETLRDKLQGDGEWSVNICIVNALDDILAAHNDDRTEAVSAAEREEGRREILRELVDAVENKGHNGADDEMGYCIFCGHERGGHDVACLWFRAQSLTKPAER